jgi:hypothetical protein
MAVVTKQFDETMTIGFLLEHANRHSELVIAVEDFFNGGLSAGSYSRMCAALDASRNLLDKRDA